MIDEFAKDYLRTDLQEIHKSMIGTLHGLSEYDIRRPLTPTGTNLLGLIKHLATWEARYLGEVFGRPFPEPLPRWDDASQSGAELWATEDETRQEIIDLYCRVGNTPTPRSNPSTSMLPAMCRGGRGPT